MYQKHEMVKEAVQTSNPQVLSTLAENQYMLVRRAVAKNRNTDSSTLTKLSYDKTLNVSWAALQNSNCRSNRELENYFFHPCVECNKDEISMLTACDNCDLLKQFEY